MKYSQWYYWIFKRKWNIHVCTMYLYASLWYWKLEVLWKFFFTLLVKNIPQLPLSDLKASVLNKLWSRSMNFHYQPFIVIGHLTGICLVQQEQVVEKHWHSLSQLWNCYINLALSQEMVGVKLSRQTFVSFIRSQKSLSEFKFNWNCRPIYTAPEKVSNKDILWQ